jgi:hypothetical protein
MQQRVLLEKLIVAQTVKKFPAFYAPPRLIAVFIRARNWTLAHTSARSIYFKIYVNIILLSTRDLQVASFHHDVRNL